MKKKFYCLVAIATVLLSSCRKNEIPVTSVSLNQSTVSIKVGQTLTLTPTVAPDNATDKRVMWRSSNKNIVTVSNTGMVTAVNIGTATIQVHSVADPGKTTTCEVTVEPKFFPDGNFRKVLVSNYGMIEQNGDIDPENPTNKEIFATTTTLSLSQKAISSLDGIEYFPALTSLNCSDNNLTVLDVSKNTALTSIDCYFNSLTALDLSKNTALTTLNCINNKLTVLNSPNTALTTLNCSSNELTTLDVSKNTALEKFYCSGNKLTALDVSKNTVLTDFYCNDNKITTLDISKNTELILLICFSNNLSTLDIRPLTTKLDISKLECGKQPGQLKLTLTAKQNTAWESGAKNRLTNNNVQTDVKQ